MKIAIILGTRPEIIKLAPVINDLERRNSDFFIIHTGQHYDYSMDKIFFKELAIKSNIINLNIGSGTHGKTTGKMLIAIEKILQKKAPDLVLVQGDTNSSLAGSLAAVKLNIKIGHIEAGLRSYDKSQPEEYNRIIIDHISYYLFAPTDRERKNLLKEGIKERVFITGNTSVDSVFQNLDIAKKRSKILKQLGLIKNGYFLATVHRQENIDFKERFYGILSGIKKVAKEYNLPVVYPVHPRARKMINKFGFEEFILDKASGNIKVIEPVGFFDFLMLQKNARLVLTDSGGVVEECCSLKVPTVCLRDYSDRPETLDVKASILAGCQPDKILQCALKMIESDRSWQNPLGDGSSAKKILNLISNEG